MSRGADPAAFDELRARIGAGSPMTPFAEAVLAQAGRPLGAGADPAREMHVARTLARLLAEDPAAPPTGAIDALVADPLLLAAFFQNIDLLYDADPEEGDRVGGWVMEALAAISGPGRHPDPPPRARPGSDADGG